MTYMEPGPNEKARCWRLLMVFVLSIAIAMMVIGAARSQEHRHPAADAAIHEKFYSNWMQPDNPGTSCCNKEDCYPTEAKFENGQWWAKRREDGKWIAVPAGKIERERDNPDGRNHVCMSPPISHFIDDDGSDYWAVVPEAVYCFSLGHGT